MGLSGEQVLNSRTLPLGVLAVRLRICRLFRSFRAARGNLLPLSRWPFAEGHWVCHHRE